MEWEDIKNKSVKDLNDLLSEKRVDLYSLNLQARGGQLKQVHKIKQLRREIAKILTALKFKKT